MATANEVAHSLRRAFQHGEVVVEDSEKEIETASAYHFEDTGLLTSDDGVLLKLEDGSEFQITVVQSA